MAWNPHPEVAALRDYARKFNRPIVVAFSIEAGGDSFNVTTFGKTIPLCKLAADFGNQISAAVRSGQIEPPPVEPFDATGEPESVRWTRERIAANPKPEGGDE